MDLSNVTVATVTWARSSEEASLLERSLACLAATGLRIAVADRGTNVAFTEALSRLPGISVRVPGEAGLVRQVQASLQLAAESQTSFLLYTEPDKELFFAEGLEPFVSRAPTHPGVVLAARSDESFRSFPPLQQHVEQVVNHLCGEATGVQGDYSYGPFLMTRGLLSHVLSRDPALGWGWRLSTFLAARNEGLAVVLLSDDYRCPEQQQQEDVGERRHRLHQLSQNALGLADALTP